MLCETLSVFRQAQPDLRLSVFGQAQPDLRRSIGGDWTPAMLYSVSRLVRSRSAVLSAFVVPPSGGMGVANRSKKPPKGGLQAIETHNGSSSTG